MPAPITLVPSVPTFIVPPLTRRRPLFVGDPFWPMTVALASFSQKPPVAGIVYAAAVKTGLEKVLEPEILNVPFEIVRKPAAFAPWTVIVPPGRTSRVEAALVPLLRMIPRSEERRVGKALRAWW